MKVFIFNSETEVYATIANSIEEAKENIRLKFNSDINEELKTQTEDNRKARQWCIDRERSDMEEAFSYEPVILDSINNTEIYFHGND